MGFILKYNFLVDSTFVFSSVNLILQEGARVCM